MEAIPIKSGWIWEARVSTRIRAKGSVTTPAGRRDWGVFWARVGVQTAVMAVAATEESPTKAAQFRAVRRGDRRKSQLSGTGWLGRETRTRDDIFPW